MPTNIYHVNTKQTISFTVLSNFVFCNMIYNKKLLYFNVKYSFSSLQDHLPDEC